MDDLPRSAEADAFLATVVGVDPTRLSACAGWTTHEIAAHVTGIHVEVSRHLEPYLQGDEVPATRGFEEREAPLQALAHDALLERLFVAERQMRQHVADVLAREPDAVIPWTGRRMAVAKFVPHLRNEHALHRWDLVGEDETSEALLGNADLVDHSVGELGRILLAAGRSHDPAPDADLVVQLRSDPEPTLVVVVRDGQATLAWADRDAANTDAGPVVELDPAARHLMIWGRRPDRHDRVRSRLARPDLARLQALLSGY